MVLPRRTFLADMGMGVTGMALGTMLAERVRCGVVNEHKHAIPRLFPAKSVIWIFLSVVIATWRPLIPSRP